MVDHFNLVLRKIMAYHEYFYKIKHFTAINDTQQLIASYLPES